jgi:hypothetical protein
MAGLDPSNILPPGTRRVKKPVIRMEDTLPAYKAAMLADVDEDEMGNSDSDPEIMSGSDNVYSDEDDC